MDGCDCLEHFYGCVWVGVTRCGWVGKMDSKARSFSTWTLIFYDQVKDHSIWLVSIRTSNHPEDSILAQDYVFSLELRFLRLKMFIFGLHLKDELAQLVIKQSCPNL